MQETIDKKKTVGILAFGSLICDPRCEIKKHRTGIKKNVDTPFNVEFARRSGLNSRNGRGGAPTLVPITDGGKEVKSQVFVMDLSEREAKDVLYRREIGEVCTDKTYDESKPGHVRISSRYNFEGLDVVLYSDIKVTIKKDDRTPKKLAEYAIKSVQAAKPFHDGISYLIAAKDCGIVTELSREYEREILEQTECECLIQALAKEFARRSCS